MFKLVNKKLSLATLLFVICLSLWFTPGIIIAATTADEAQAKAKSTLLDGEEKTGLAIPFIWRKKLQQQTRRETEEISTAEPFYFFQDSQLNEIIHQALENNPELRHMEAQWRAAVEKVAQVTALPEPMLQITQFIESVETRVGPQENAFMISQQFPFLGKLPLKGQMAYHEALARAWQYRAKQREIILKAKQYFYDLYFLKKALEINNREMELLQRIEQIALTYYATGKGIQQNVLKVQTEITRLVNEREILKQQQASMSSMLNALMGKPQETAIYEPTEFDLPDITLKLDELYSIGEAYREELKSAYHSVKKSNAAVKLAKKDYWPDFTIGANFINIGDREDPVGRDMPPPDNGQDAYSISVGVKLPIWLGKLRAQVKEANHMKQASESSYEKIEDAMEFDIRDRYLRLTTISDLIRLYEATLIPQAEHTLQSSEAAYSTGQLSFLELLDSERTLLKVRLAYQRLRADYMKNLAEMERAIGQAFPAGE